MISLHRSHVLLLLFLAESAFWVKQCPSIARSSNAVSLKHNAFRDMRSLSKPITLWKCQMTIFQFFGIFSCSSSTCRADPSKNTLRMGELLCNSPTWRVNPSKKCFSNRWTCFPKRYLEGFAQTRILNFALSAVQKHVSASQSDFEPHFALYKRGFWKSRCVCFSCVKIDRLKSV